MIQSVIKIIFCTLFLFTSSLAFAGNDKSNTAHVNLQGKKSVPTLLFFINPNGGPCRKQDTILLSLKEEMADKVTLRYVQTNEKADRKIFYSYGIRALPTLLLADARGREIARMPPGIRSAQAIRTLIEKNTSK